MIAKKIPRESGERTAAVQITALVSYIFAGDHDDPADKLIAGGALNMYSGSAKATAAEMVALSMATPKSKMPVAHWVLSWKKGEIPSTEQAREAVEMFVKNLGFAGHQIVWGVHGNTSNRHVHIAINRINPETEKVVKPHKGFDRLAAQRAVTRIEHTQGWMPERGAKYGIDADGNVRPKSELRDANAEANADDVKSFRPGYRANAIEIHQGVKCQHRIAHEKLSGILKNARSWGDLHAMLAYAGATYEPFGGGAVIKINGVTIKASDLQASPKKLVKRLGPFRPCPPEFASAAADTPPSPSKPVDDDAAAYQKERVIWNESRKKAVAEFDARADARKDELQAQQSAERDSALRGSWKGRGDEKNALESVLADKRAHERAELQADIKRERVALRARFPDFPDFNEWKRRRVQRERDETIQAIEADGMNANERAEAVTMQTLKENMRREIAAIPPSAPIEERHAIEIKALERFIADAGVDGASARDAMRARHARQIYEATPEGALETFHGALGADGYRINTRVEGKPINQFLGRYDREKGEKPPHFTPDEIRRDWLALMKRRATACEHIYYTPISTSRHFILIDDLDSERLAKLKSAGYLPALVQQSSPGNYQAFLTAPHIAPPGAPEAEIEHRAANAIFRSINKEFGDEKISAVVHPARAPGFPNSKEKHRRADGVFPIVRIVEAVGDFCQKLVDDLAAAVREVGAVVRKAAPPARVANRAEVSPPQLGAPEADADRLHALFVYHWREAARLASGAPDVSRIDYRAAIRLRVIGYNQGEIANAIRIVGPTMRSDGGASKGSFAEYAEKTAAAAFGPAGDAEAAKYAHWARQWASVLDDDDEDNEVDAAPIRDDSPRPE